MNHLSRVFMSLLLGVAGYFHLVTPRAFIIILPPELPWKLEIVVMTGLLELAFIPGLWIKRARRRSAQLLALYFALLLPVHIYMAIEEIPLGSFDQSWMLWLRVVLQFPLIYWAFQISKLKKDPR